MQYKRAFIDNSYVFITVVTSKRRPILINNIGLVRKTFKQAKKFYEFEIYAAVILPDHIHLLIKTDRISDYPTIIRLIKGYISRNIDVSTITDYEISNSQRNKKEKDIWQRRYWEHTITNEQDLYNHLDYIHFNPVKHNYVQNVKDWKYSSFHKFIKMEYYVCNWGSCEEIKNIKDLNYE